MATQIPRVIADLELQLATAISIGATSFTLSSAEDDDGEALPAGIYVFAVDSGTSNKEYILGQLSGASVTAVKTVSRQGVQTSGAARAHRVGAPVILTNFAALQLVADTLRGTVDLDAGAPLAYDAEPTLADREQLATVGYVLDNVTGGTVAFDKQTISGTAGATIAAGDLVYLDEVDQEWKLCDADTTATVEGVMRGIALGSGTDGGAISGGVHLAGAWTTTGLTAGAVYYASNTAGDLTTSAGTVKHVVGVALSTTRLWVIPQNREAIPTRTKDALAGGGDFGTPSGSNKFVTQQYVNDVEVVTFTVSGTWTKDPNLKYVIVEVVGGGGGSAGSDDVASENGGGGGGGGGYSRKKILAANLSSTETVTVGEGGTAGGSASGNGGPGGTSSFGSLVTATGGEGGTRNGNGGNGGLGSLGDVNLYGFSGGTGGGSGNGGGNGGGSVLGGGAKGANDNANGNTGIGHGGGAGGGCASSGSGDRAGAAGAAGVVIVTEYYA